MHRTDDRRHEQQSVHSTLMYLVPREKNNGKNQGPGECNSPRAGPQSNGRGEASREASPFINSLVCVHHRLATKAPRPHHPSTPLPHQPHGPACGRLSPAHEHTTCKCAPRPHCRHAHAHTAPTLPPPHWKHGAAPETQSSSSRRRRATVPQSDNFRHARHSSWQESNPRTHTMSSRVQWGLSRPCTCTSASSHVRV